MVRNVAEHRRFLSEAITCLEARHCDLEQVCIYAWSVEFRRLTLTIF